MGEDRYQIRAEAKIKVEAKAEIGDQIVYGLQD